jgi:hypothetical protein
VAILIPKSYRINFFLEPPTSQNNSYSFSHYSSTSEQAKPRVLEWIDWLLAKSIEDPSNTSNKYDLAQICKMVTRRIKAWRLKPAPALSWRETTSPPFPNEVLARVVKLSVELDEKVLFVDAYGLWADRGPHEAVLEKSSPETFQYAGIAFLRYDLEHLLPK